eukprot:scaffold5025_cov79-Skeletonema_menzelii.AAC.1
MWYLEEWGTFTKKEFDALETLDTLREDMVESRIIKEVEGLLVLTDWDKGRNEELFHVEGFEGRSEFERVFNPRRLVVVFREVGSVEFDLRTRFISLVLAPITTFPSPKPVRLTSAHMRRDTAAAATAGRRSQQKGLEHSS